jgi:hypothetical protein
MTEEQFLQYKFKSESDSLDFKSEQYKFTSATEEQKSELLKDILAMANSWREETGYIILGVIDKPEKPNELVGIKDHIDDSRFQEFINSKTNKVCSFSYKTITYQSLTFGIFEIPVQKRPLFLKKQFGKLKQDTVYVRRGSSTTEAKPDEISSMGNSISPHKDHPVLNLFFHDHDNNSKAQELTSDTHEVICVDEIPDYIGGSNIYFSALNMVNSNYYREWLEHYNFKNAFQENNFCIENSGTSEAKNIEVELKIDKNDFDILIDGEEIKYPDEDDLMSIVRFDSKYQHVSNLEIQETNTHYLIKTNINALHAKRFIEIDGQIYVKPHKSSQLLFSSLIYCDGESSPFKSELNVIFNHTIQKITSEKLIGAIKI